MKILKILAWIIFSPIIALFIFAFWPIILAIYVVDLSIYKEESVNIELSEEMTEFLKRLRKDNEDYFTKRSTTLDKQLWQCFDESTGTG